MKRLLLAREAGRVRRFHTTRILHPESVAEHSFNVVNLMLILTGGVVSKQALVAALVHDMGEPLVGDIPSPVKRALPVEVSEHMEKLERDAIAEIHPLTSWEEWQITEEEEELISLCDKLDGLLKCIEELESGNKTIIPIGNRYVNYIYGMVGDGIMHDLTAKIIDTWQRGVIPCQLTTDK